MQHDVSWKEDFLSESERIKSAARDSSNRIEHIGSTSVPNIYAKLILDIAILCGEKGLEAVAAALKGLGYDYRGQYEEESGHFYAVLDRENICYCQTHIYAEANKDWNSKLKFRDVLRENAALAREYNEYKIELAKKVSSKKQYAEIKDKWVDSFIRKVFANKIMSKKNIEAIVEIYPFEINPPWEIVSTANFFRLALSSKTTDDEIGSVILTACEYNQIDVETSAERTLENFISNKFVLPGGLQFSADDELKIFPGCCCGLETWNDWFGVPSGRSVWAGHDPYQGVEFTDGKIRVWQDKKAENVPFIDFEYDEMHAHLEKVKSDLSNFLFRLNKWTEFIAPQFKDKVLKHFAENMNI